MKKTTISLLAVLLLFLAGCAATVVAPTQTSQNDFKDLEKLDVELTEPWPQVDAAVELTPQERNALESQQNIPIKVTEHSARQIQSEFLYLTRRAPEAVHKWIKRSETYLPFIKKVFAEKNLPEELSYLPFIESGFNPKAYSRAGAAGLWQFIPSTGKRFGLRCDKYVDERLDPYKSTYAAADYLKELYEMFGDWTLALASYNCGEAKVAKAVADTGGKDFFELSANNDAQSCRFFRETLRYVPMFLAVVKVASNLESLGFPSIDMNAATAVAQVELKPGTNLIALAKASGMDWNAFQDYSLAFRRGMCPFDQPTALYLPVKYAAAAKDALAKPGKELIASAQSYTVQKGDTWGGIAGRFGLTADALKKANQKTSNLLSIGQEVILPPGEALIAAAPAKAAASAAPVDPAKAAARKETQKIATHRANYKVKNGDTLGSIAHSTGVSVGTLLQANGLSSPKALRAGQDIYIPDRDPAKGPTQPNPPLADKSKAIVYSVQSGDTIESISKKFEVSQLDLLHWNNLTPKTVLQIGARLNIRKN